MKERTIKELQRFFTFALVGMTAFAVLMAVTVILTELVRFPYYVSYAIGLLLAWVLNFIGQMNITFEATGNVMKRFGRFTIASIVHGVTSWLLVLFLVEVFGLHYVITIVIVTPVLAIGNFIAQKMWVFKKQVPRKS
jgi:putative flippase GtrA